MRTQTSRLGLPRAAVFCAIPILILALDARAKENDSASALVGVVAEIANPSEGKALWRAGGAEAWREATILQNLEQNNQLALEGATRIRVFFFRDKNLVNLTSETASAAAPFVVNEKRAKAENTRKMIDGLKSVTDSLPGALRGENLQMTDLLTRSPEPYCVLVAPRNTRIDNPTPAFEWFESYGRATTLTLSLDGQTVWQAASGEKESRMEYPSGRSPLEAGRTYSIRLESPGAQSDVTHCIYEPLSKREAKIEAEWDKTLPPKTEVAGAALRAARAFSNGRLEAARAILTEGLALHPDDRTLRGLLIAVYLEQGNGCFSDREIAEYEKRK